MPRDEVPINEQLRLDLTQVSSALRDVEQRARALKPLWRELRKPFAHDQKSHAKQETDEGAPWPPRSPITEAKRKRRNRSKRTTLAMRTVMIGKLKRRQSTPKQLLGRLTGANTFQSGPLFMRFISRVNWSGAHMAGARVGRGRKVRLPKRRYLWLSRMFLKYTGDRLSTFIVAKWGKK